MNILGITGWNSRSHDAAACIIRDGELLFAVEEERITRKKHAFDLVPIQSVAYALKYTGLTIDDIDIVAFGWNLNKLLGKNIPESEIIDTLLPKQMFKYQVAPKLVLVPHHLAHAYYTYYSSPFAGKPASVLIVDGQGEDESTSLGYASADGILLDHRLPASQSLGYFYESACRFLGYSNLDGGKVMGLAGYGSKGSAQFTDPMKYDDQRLAGFPDLPQQGLDIEEEVISWWIDRMKTSFNLPVHPKTYALSSSFRFERERRDNIEIPYASVASTVQVTLERLLSQMAQSLRETHKVSDLVLGGGVALNCSANRAIADQGFTIHVPPSPADSGVAIGAAVYATLQNNEGTVSGLASPYVGPSYTNPEIKNWLERNQISYQYTDNPSQLAASLIDQNLLVGWFQDRMEFGPRALGNRSILANPLVKGNKERLNSLKGREQWRPLGVSITAEAATNYFDSPALSPYMMITARVNDKMKSFCPDIVHIDQTSRPQVVKRSDNPKFYDLISKFGSLSNVPMIINTSFNRYDEPIVNSPEDAVRTFFTTPLDVLIMNNYVIYKK